MATPGPQSVGFAIRGPITRADLPGLCDRVCGLLEESGAGVVLCDVHGVESDAVTVDALARLQLAARRHGCRVRLCSTSSALRDLVSFMGLTDILLER
ncbi:MAG TPA: STAS domain-containing protein [Gaiellaceae bacterium]|nr:STAS domain-containing protein [Gaiellaceae bacterium]